MHKVYRYALSQKVRPIYVSEYLRKVQDFNDIVITREGDGWGIHGAHDLITVRIPAKNGIPDLSSSENITGFSDHNDDRYISIHRGSGYAHLLLRPAETPGSVIAAREQR